MFVTISPFVTRFFDEFRVNFVSRKVPQMRNGIKEEIVPSGRNKIMSFIVNITDFNENLI